MGLLDRMARLIQAEIYDRLRRDENPEKLLEQIVIDMQEDLVQLRQAVAGAIATQKRSEQQYDKAMQDAESWRKKAQSALDKDDEERFSDAQFRAKEYTKAADSIKKTLDSQVEQSETLKRGLIQIEMEISGMKTRKDMLKSRSTAAQAQERMNRLVTDYEQVIGKAEDSELYWLKTRSNIQIDLEQLRQTLGGAVANQASLQKQYDQAIKIESNWQQKAQTASDNGNQALLAEALAQKKIYSEVAANKQNQIDTSLVTIALLQHYLISLEGQLHECQANIDKKNRFTQIAEFLQRLKNLQDDIDYLATISNSAETDPIQYLQAVQAKYRQLHQTLAEMIISQGTAEQQYNETIREEGIARRQSDSAFAENNLLSGLEALSNKIRYTKMAAVLQKQFDSQAAEIPLLGNSLREIERQIHQIQNRICE
jgi:phage shock protein A